MVRAGEGKKGWEKLWRRGAGGSRVSRLLRSCNEGHSGPSYLVIRMSTQHEERGLGLCSQEGARGALTKASQ